MTSSHGPVFIAGQARSGKTYMRLMIAAHPAFSISRRTQLWTRYYGAFGDLADADNFNRCLSDMLTNKHIQALQPDVAAIQQAFRDEPATYPDLFALLHEHFAAQNRRQRWGDQSEGIEFLAPVILDAYADAVMIHLIRDPRDRYEALIAQRRSNRWRIADSTACWVQSAGCAVENSRRYPDRYLVVRYETLVSRPQEVIQAICELLAIRPVREMAKLGNAPRFGVIAPGTSPLSASYIGRFRACLAPYEISYIQQHAGPNLQAFGYTLEATRPSRIDAVRFQALDGLGAALGVRRRQEELGVPEPET